MKKTGALVTILAGMFCASAAYAMGAGSIGSLGSLGNLGNNSSNNSSSNSSSDPGGNNVIKAPKGMQCNDLIQQAQNQQFFDCGLSKATTGDIIALPYTVIQYINQQNSGSGGGQQSSSAFMMACRVTSTYLGASQPYLTAFCPGRPKFLDVAGDGDSQGFGTTITIYQNCSLPQKVMSGCAPAGTSMGGSTSTGGGDASSSNGCSLVDVRQKIGSFACGSGGGGGGGTQVWDQFVVYHAPQAAQQQQSGGNCQLSQNILEYETPGKCQQQGGGGQQAGGGGQQQQLDPCSQDVVNGCMPPINLWSDAGLMSVNYGPGATGATHTGWCLPSTDGKWYCQLPFQSDTGGQNSNGSSSTP